MRYSSFALSVVIIVSSAFSQWKEKPGKWETLRITRSGPSGSWVSGWGIANGRVSARVMCKVKNEKIYLNDNTFWAGYPREYSEPAAYEAFKKTRQLLLEGKNAEADVAARKLQSFHCFPNVLTGNLFLDFDGSSTYSNYKNLLNLDSAMLQMWYTTVDGVRHTREIFVSYPDQVMVIRLAVDKKGSLGFAVRMNSIDDNGRSLWHKVWADGNNTLVMQAFACDGGGTDTSQEKCDVRVQVTTSGGSCSGSGTSLKVTGADTALLLLSIGTSYNGPFKHPSPHKEGLDPVVVSKSHLDPAAKKTYQQLLTTHVQDYQKIFRRFWIELNGGNPGGRAVDFQYIRFEQLQASRGPKGQPPAIQGIWNESNTPEWGGYYTINSEGVKEHFASEAGNIPECIEPMVNFVEELAVNGAKTAKVNYGCRGWMAHHNSDPWKHTSMPGMKGFHPYWVCWMFGGAFTASLVSDHYQYSGDIKFLKEHAYPVMKGVALFCLDYLIDNGKGKLVPSISSSPENMYRHSGASDVAVCLGSAGDLALIRQSFLDFIEYSKTLNVDAGLRDSVQAAYDKLLPFQVGKKGQLLEWNEEYDEAEPHHRHASHLIGAFPLRIITRQNTPDFWKAAKKSMELRADGAYLPAPEGMWARFLEVEKSLNAGSTSIPVGPRRNPGEIYMGFPELFLQSNAGELDILPAVTSSIASGKILGLRGRTGYEVDLEWSNSKLTHATIRSSVSKVPPKVRIHGELVPDAANDPRITLEYVQTGLGPDPVYVPFPKTLRIVSLSNIVIPKKGAYSVSVFSIRGQLVQSIKGNGPATLRLHSHAWAPGLYVLKIVAGNGNVTAVHKISNPGSGRASILR